MRLGVKKLTVSPEKTADNARGKGMASSFRIISFHFKASSDQFTNMSAETIASCQPFCDERNTSLYSRRMFAKFSLLITCLYMNTKATAAINNLMAPYHILLLFIALLCSMPGEQE